jgi:hypothetical protein
LSQRREQEAQNLALLTGWSVSDVRSAMKIASAPPAPAPATWWQRIWRD